MQVICPISGISLLKCDYLLGEVYSDVAPIFRKPRNKLLVPDTAFKFSKATSLTEKKLYFLAVVNCTDLVSFHTIAKPSLQTCEKNFYQAIQLAGWMDFASFSIAKEVSFPRYVVREENADLDNISIWLSSIQDIRDDFLKKDSDRERSFRLNQHNQKLRKELTNAVLKDKMFTPSILDWLFDYASLQNHPKISLYKRVLLTPMSEAAFISKDLLQEITELLSDTFGLEHPMAAPIFGQLHQLELKRREGFTSFQILDEEYSSIEDGEVVSSRQPLPEVYQQKLLAEFGSLEEPKQADFPTRARFLIAHAKWQLAQKKGNEDGSLI